MSKDFAHAFSYKNDPKNPYNLRSRSRNSNSWELKNENASQSRQNYIRIDSGGCDPFGINRDNNPLQRQSSRNSPEDVVPIEQKIEGNLKNMNPNLINVIETRSITLRNQENINSIRQIQHAYEEVKNEEEDKEEEEEEDKEEEEEEEEDKEEEEVRKEENNEVKKEEEKEEKKEENEEVGRATQQNQNNQRPSRQIILTIAKVIEWRSLCYSDLVVPGQQVLSKREAARRVSMSKKSLDEYLMMIRKGIASHFSFDEHRYNEFGVLRRFVKNTRREDSKWLKKKHIDIEDLHANLL